MREREREKEREREENEFREGRGLFSDCMGLGDPSGTFPPSFLPVQSFR